MKTLTNMILVAAALTLTACAGGGGSDGGGGGGTPTPSVTLSGITHNSSGGTKCVKSGSLVTSYANNYTNSSSCASAGGTWSSASYPSSGDVCRVGSRDFNLRATGSANGAETTACVDAGGTVVSQNSETQSYCDISSVSPAITCSDIGGTEYSTEVLTGSINSSVSAGTNTISADPTEVDNALGNPFGGLDNITVTPAVITAEVTISNYWDYPISMTYSVTSFQSAVSASVKFSATSPMAVSGNFSFRSNTVKVYYRPY